MKPVRTCLDFPWMHRPSLVQLSAIFRNVGADLFLVGGCVRDSLLGKPVHDIDLATPLLPGEVIHLLRDAGIHWREMGIAFGTVMAVVGKEAYEITTFRKDIDTDGRHAKVAYTQSMAEDAARRDFTFNSLYLSFSGQLYDPWNGLEHLKEGQVVFIGDPAQRIQEDYLRILRYFRFYAFLGRQVPDEDLLSLLAHFSDSLEHISRERIHSEMMRLLSAPEPLRALELMDMCHVSEKFCGIRLDLHEFGKLLQAEKRTGAPPNSLLRFFVLYHKNLETILPIFPFSKADRHFLEKLETFPEKAGLSLQRWLYDEGLCTAYGFACLKAMAERDFTFSASEASMVRQWQRPLFPLNGLDALELGLAGPHIGIALRATENWWADQCFHPSRSECLQYLRGISGKLFPGTAP